MFSKVSFNYKSQSDTCVVYSENLAVIWKEIMENIVSSLSCANEDEPSETAKITQLKYHTFQLTRAWASSFRVGCATSARLNEALLTNHRKCGDAGKYEPGARVLTRVTPERRIKKFRYENKSFDRPASGAASSVTLIILMFEKHECIVMSGLDGVQKLFTRHFTGSHPNTWAILFHYPSETWHRLGGSCFLSRFQKRSPLQPEFFFKAPGSGSPVLLRS